MTDATPPPGTGDGSEPIGERRGDGPGAADELEVWLAEGMHEALREVAAPSRRQTSTLRWLALRRDDDQRLAVPPPSAAPGVPSTEGLRSADAARKYEILGALGHGGMGIVLRGHDSELGRDVAVKLLHGRHCTNPDLVQRFVAEARICGQLQHPGIVPVYDLGIDAGRPFFTMKLVDGQTLATLLDARTSLSADRPGLLRIFEQVCQTMAYAHARGVIHGDLKPANVMVGAFGEVQVMDWGFAQTVGPGAADRGRVHAGDQATAPDVGSVCGTPGYMPPEQARGDLARMDARSDVFALGSILCEILTGARAHTGDQECALAKARAGATQDAHSRLRASDAEQDLVALTLACLSADAEDRPRSAQAVADRIASHLASAARRAEAARFKVMSARRSQRLTVVLAAVFALVLTLGTGGTLWLLRMRRELQLAGDVGEQMHAAEASLLVAQSGGLDEAKWRHAVDTAVSARERARDKGADADLVEKASLLCGKVERSQADTFLRAALERIRIPQNHCVSLGSASNREARRRHTGYTREFAAHGFKPLTESPERIADLIRATSIGEDLVMALDDWAVATLTVAEWGEYGGAEMRQRARQLLAAARAADPDPMRGEMREKLAGEAPHGLDLLRILDSRGEAELPRATVLLAAMALRTLHHTKPAVKRLTEAQRDAPDDFWLAFELALAHETSSVPDWERASHFYALAEALRPDLHVVQAHHAYALAKAGRVEEAEQLMRRALTRGSRDANAQNALGVVLLERHRLEEARAQFQLAMSLDPDCTIACSNLGRTLFVLCHPAEARERVLELPESARTTMAAAHKLLADIAAEGPATREEALDGYTRALAIQPDFAEAHYAKALVLRRLGRHEFAKDSLEAASASGWASPEGWEGSLRLELAARAGGRAEGVWFDLLPARSAFEQQRFADAARLYVAISARIELLSPQSWDAVCAAVLASGATGTGADAGQRDSWQRFALARLTSELEALRPAARSPLPDDRRRAAAHLRRWLREPDLDGVREKARLEHRPKSEATAWRAFWLEVGEELPH